MIWRQRDEREKPLFADSAQRREAAWENYRNSSRPGRYLFECILCIGLLAAIFYLGRYAEKPSWYFRSMCWMLAIMLVCAIPTELASYLWMKKGEGCDGYRKAGRPRWLRCFSSATEYITILALFGILAIKGIEAGMTGNTIGVIWIALCPVLFLAGAYMRLALRWNIPGLIVMFAGVMAFFTDLDIFY